MTRLVVIPARMASQRLPGKPLADIGGESMIVRVWRQAVAANVGPVVVAAAEREIAAAVEAAGGHAVLTDPALPSGSDRVFAAAEMVAGSHDVVVNVQGDLPMLDPEAVRASVEVLEHAGADIGTVAAEIDNAADCDNPAVVKPVVVWDASGSRGGYAFRRDALARFVKLPPSPLELRERLEQLRALEDGMSIWVARVRDAPISVDTAEDLEKARAANRQAQK